MRCEAPCSCEALEALEAHEPKSQVTVTRLRAIRISSDGAVASCTLNVSVHRSRIPAAAPASKPKQRGALAPTEARFTVNSLLRPARGQAKALGRMEAYLSHWDHEGGRDERGS